MLNANNAKFQSRKEKPSSASWRIAPFLGKPSGKTERRFF